MNKRTKVILLFSIILIASPIGFVYVLNNGNPYTKYIANKYIPEHLEEIGYEKGQLKVSDYGEPKYLINKDFYHGHYMVVFIDEPDTRYFYGVTKKGKQVKQFCEKDVLSANGVSDMVVSKTKHSEKKCVNFLDNRD
ncbi:hypothetical protein JOC78_000788 [Bacillus ectoiniformans]|uniref:DUF3139 domain-containing protein n=1 Tax=Bacillus ectoiniformans TaxID=1494429 RepID=UPI0019560F89|nr:DUF3139 domain-containing protein [Bacillus ectoiniformans]MBM7647848.1 hypothetical protein [Bacillus ectoiniformans]